MLPLVIKNYVAKIIRIGSFDTPPYFRTESETSGDGMILCLCSPSGLGMPRLGKMTSPRQNDGSRAFRAL